MSAATALFIAKLKIKPGNISFKQEGGKKISSTKLEREKHRKSLQEIPGRSEGAGLRVLLVARKGEVRLGSGGKWAVVRDRVIQAATVTAGGQERWG